MNGTVKNRQLVGEFFLAREEDAKILAKFAENIISKFPLLNTVSKLRQWFTFVVNQDAAE